MTRLTLSVCALLTGALMAPVMAQAAKHGPDITLDQLENVQSVSLQLEEYSPFTLRAEAPAQFKLAGLPLTLESLQDREAEAPQNQICASIRESVAGADAKLADMLSVALDMDFCADQPG